MKLREKSSHSGGTEAAPRGGLPYPPGSVTSDNFVEKAVAFMRASGRTEGHPVIRKADNLRAWVCWIAFLRQIGRPVTFVESHGVMTLPTEFPWEFSSDADGIFNRADELVDGRRERPASELSPQRRAQLANALRSRLPMMNKRQSHSQDGREKEIMDGLKPWKPGDVIPSLSKMALAR